MCIMYNGGVETEGNLFTKLFGIDRLRNRQGDLAMFKGDLPAGHPLIKETEAAINKAKWSIAERIGFTVLALGSVIAFVAR